MTGLRDDFAGREGLHEGVAPATHPVSTPPADFGPRRARRDIANDTGMVELHESIAALLASRGQWRQAYHHLRSALDILSTEDTPRIPEQLRHEVNRLRKEHAEAREQSLRDSLTASYNRRYLDERLADLLADTTGNGLAVGLVDLDWFKQVNDTYGHLLGDRVLQRVVELLQEALPDGGFCARYGGEEFVLVLPAVDRRAAVAACEAARTRVETYSWSQLAPGLRVTVSIGMTHGLAGNERESTSPNAEQQLISADALLYAAKQSGRNAVAYRTGNEVRIAGLATDRRPAATSRIIGY
ncbi:GGDEF domain-containing protein [Parasphingorhabdus pacifica]